MHSFLQETVSLVRDIFDAKFNNVFLIFFLSKFSDADNSQGSRWREGTITFTRSRNLRLLFATFHVRWLSHIFNRPLAFTRLLLDEIYHLLELPFDWLMIWGYFLFVYLLIWYCVFVTGILTQETGGLELASTITLVLQENRLTNNAIYPKYS